MLRGEPKKQASTNSNIRNHNNNNTGNFEDESSFLFKSIKKALREDNTLTGDDDDALLNNFNIDDTYRTHVSRADYSLFNCTVNSATEVGREGRVISSSSLIDDNDVENELLPYVNEERDNGNGNGSAGSSSLLYKNYNEFNSYNQSGNLPSKVFHFESDFEGDSRARDRDADRSSQLEESPALSTQLSNGMDEMNLSSEVMFLRNPQDLSNFNDMIGSVSLDYDGGASAGNERFTTSEHSNKSVVDNAAHQLIDSEFRILVDNNNDNGNFSANQSDSTSRDILNAQEDYMGRNNDEEEEVTTVSSSFYNSNNFENIRNEMAPSYLIGGDDFIFGGKEDQTNPASPVLINNQSDKEAYSSASTSSCANYPRFKEIYFDEVSPQKESGEIGKNENNGATSDSRHQREQEEEEVVFESLEQSEDFASSDLILPNVIYDDEQDDGSEFISNDEVNDDHSNTFDDSKNDDSHDYFREDDQLRTPKNAKNNGGIFNEPLATAIKLAKTTNESNNNIYPPNDLLLPPPFSTKKSPSIANPMPSRSPLPSNVPLPSQINEDEGDFSFDGRENSLGSFGKVEDEEDEETPTLKSKQKHLNFEYSINNNNSESSNSKSSNRNSNKMTLSTTDQRLYSTNSSDIDTITRKRLESKFSSTQLSGNLLNSINGNGAISSSSTLPFETLRMATWQRQNREKELLFSPGEFFGVKSGQLGDLEGVGPDVKRPSFFTPGQEVRRNNNNNGESRDSSPLNGKITDSTNNNNELKFDYPLITFSPSDIDLIDLGLLAVDDRGSSGKREFEIYPSPYAIAKDQREITLYIAFNATSANDLDAFSLDYRPLTGGEVDSAEFKPCSHIQYKTRMTEEGNGERGAITFFANIFQVSLVLPECRGIQFRVSCSAIPDLYSFGRMVEEKVAKLVISSYPNSEYPPRCNHTKSIELKYKLGHCDLQIPPTLYENPLCFSVNAVKRSVSQSLHLYNGGNLPCKVALRLSGRNSIDFTLQINNNGSNNGNKSPEDLITIEPNSWLSFSLYYCASSFKSFMSRAVLVLSPLSGASIPIQLIGELSNATNGLLRESSMQTEVVSLEEASSQTAIREGAVEEQWRTISLNATLENGFFDTQSIEYAQQGHFDLCWPNNCFGVEWNNNNSNNNLKVSFEPKHLLPYLPDLYSMAKGPKVVNDGVVDDDVKLERQFDLLFYERGISVDSIRIKVQIRIGNRNKGAAYKRSHSIVNNTNNGNFCYLGNCIFIVPPSTNADNNNNNATIMEFPQTHIGSSSFNVLKLINVNERDPIEFNIQPSSSSNSNSISNGRTSKASLSSTSAQMMIMSNYFGFSSSFGVVPANMCTEIAISFNPKAPTSNVASEKQRRLLREEEFNIIINVKERGGKNTLASRRTYPLVCLGEYSIPSNEAAAISRVKKNVYSSHSSPPPPPPQSQTPQPRMMMNESDDFSTTRQVIRFESYCKGSPMTKQSNINGKSNTSNTTKSINTSNNNNSRKVYPQIQYLRLSNPHQYEATLKINLLRSHQLDHNNNNELDFSLSSSTTFNNNKDDDDYEQEEERLVKLKPGQILALPIRYWPRRMGTSAQRILLVTSKLDDPTNTIKKLSITLKGSSSIQ